MPPTRPLTPFLFIDRRAQYLVAGSTVASSSDASDLDYDDDDDDDYDEEAQRRPFQIGEREFEVEDPGTPTTQQRDDSFIGQLEWDDEDSNSARDILRREHTALVSERSRRLQVPTSLQTQSPSNLAPPSEFREDTPLLTKKVSFSAFPRPYHGLSAVATGSSLPVAQEEAPAPFRRRFSTSSGTSKATQRNWGGQSTFGQTVRSFR